MEDERLKAEKERREERERERQKIKQIKYYAISHLTFCCVYGYQTFFGSNLLAIVSRNVGTKGHLRKEIVLLKYQFFRFMTKSGGQFELLN